MFTMPKNMFPEFDKSLPGLELVLRIGGVVIDTSDRIALSKFMINGP